MKLFAEKFEPVLSEAIGELYELYVYVDGQFFRGPEARMSVWNRGLWYGDAVFEGLRAYDGQILKLEEHLKRLHDSAKATAISIPLTSSELAEVIHETLRLNDLREAHIRVIVIRGVGRPGLNPGLAVRASVCVLAYPFPPTLGNEPVRLIISSFRRKSPVVVDAKIKNVNYMESILALLQARVANANDAVMLDAQGFVAETTGANIFIVRDGLISTPDTVAALAGVTRAIIIEIAQQHGYPIQERRITPQELYVADEIFLTGSGAEVVAVSDVDGRTIGTGVTGPVTRSIIEEYRRLCHTLSAPAQAPALD